MFTQYFVKKHEFNGTPKESDFEFVEEYMDIELNKGGKVEFTMLSLMSRIAILCFLEKPIFQ